MKTVAALFVQPDGYYSDIDFVDAWTIERDARRYCGNLPVVAHPPCQLWGAMAKANFARWGGEHNRPGKDGGCFYSALLSVMSCGGVLEHPAKTMAWAQYGLERPAIGKWTQCSNGGWVCEVWQSAYGHKANKATWLFYRGRRAPFDLDWTRQTGTHQIGFPDKRGKAMNKPTLCRREANATPVRFGATLIALAIYSTLEKEVEV